MGIWAGPGASSDLMVKGKTFLPFGIELQFFDRSVSGLVTILSELFRPLLLLEAFRFVEVGKFFHKHLVLFLSACNESDGNARYFVFNNTHMINM
jgi:hypothetical protein